jgi:hypothetical protein
VHGHPISVLAGFNVYIILNLAVGRGGVSVFFGMQSKVQHRGM